MQRCAILIYLSYVTKCNKFFRIICSWSKGELYFSEFLIFVKFRVRKFMLIGDTSCWTLLHNCWYFLWKTFCLRLPPLDIFILRKQVRKCTHNRIIVARLLEFDLWEWRQWPQLNGSVIYTCAGFMVPIWLGDYVITEDTRWWVPGWLGNLQGIEIHV